MNAIFKLPRTQPRSVRNARIPIVRLEKDHSATRPFVYRTIEAANPDTSTCYVYNIILVRVSWNVNYRKLLDLQLIAEHIRQELGTATTDFCNPGGCDYEWLLGHEPSHTARFTDTKLVACIASATPLFVRREDYEVITCRLRKWVHVHSSVGHPMIVNWCVSTIGGETTDTTSFGDCLHRFSPARFNLCIFTTSGSVDADSDDVDSGQSIPMWAVIGFEELEQGRQKLTRDYSELDLNEESNGNRRFTIQIIDY